MDDEIYQLIDFSGQNDVKRFLKGADNIIAKITPGQAFGEFQVDNKISETNMFYFVC